MTKAATKTRAAKKSPASASDILRIEYVPLDQVSQWDKNPKKHDVGGIWQSIQQHGFKDPAKFEPALNGGEGGFVEGNGRTSVLTEMRAAGEQPPRGIVSMPDGSWLIPVLFGVDAASERAAEAYGVDHNNLTMMGGDFDGFDIAKMWDQTGYAALLAACGNEEALPVSIDGEDVDDLIARLTREPEGVSGSGESGGAASGSSPNLVPDGDRYREQYAVIVVCENEMHQRETYDALHAEGYVLKVVST